MAAAAAVGLSLWVCRAVMRVDEASSTSATWSMRGLSNDTRGLPNRRPLSLTAASVCSPKLSASRAAMRRDRVLLELAPLLDGGSSRRGTRRGTRQVLSVLATGRWLHASESRCCSSTLAPTLTAGLALCSSSPSSKATARPRRVESASQSQGPLVEAGGGCLLVVLVLVLGGSSTSMASSPLTELEGAPWQRASRAKSGVRASCSSTGEASRGWSLSRHSSERTMRGS